LLFPNIPNPVTYSGQVIFRAAGRHIKSTVKIYFIVESDLIYSWKVI